MVRFRDILRGIFEDMKRTIDNNKFNIKYFHFLTELLGVFDLLEYGDVNYFSIEKSIEPNAEGINIEPLLRCFHDLNNTTFDSEEQKDVSDFLTLFMQQIDYILHLSYMIETNVMNDTKPMDVIQSPSHQLNIMKSNPLKGQLLHIITNQMNPKKLIQYLSESYYYIPVDIILDDTTSCYPMDQPIISSLQLSLRDFTKSYEFDYDWNDPLDHSNELQYASDCCASYDYNSDHALSDRCTHNSARQCDIKTNSESNENHPASVLLDHSGKNKWLIAQCDSVRDIGNNHNAIVADRSNHDVYSTTKRIIFNHKQLPVYLFILIKRFYFDFNLLRQKKNNKSFSFPFLLHMKTFCNTPAQSSDAIISYQYVLSGVIIHKGKATSGHYYSIQRKQREFRLDAYDSVEKYMNEEWIECDDHEIETYKFHDYFNCVPYQESLQHHSHDNQPSLNNLLITSLKLVKKSNENPYMLIYDAIK
jgi:hypothetical protein